jgi:hypothetical protein
MFAYVIAAYLVADKLSRLQLIAVTVLCSVYFTFPALATFGEQIRIQNLTRRFSEEHRQEFLHYCSEGSGLDYLMYVGLGTSLIVWALSILFMYDRRNKSASPKL